MLTSKEHANAQLISINKIRELLLPLRHIPSLSQLDPFIELLYSLEKMRTNKALLSWKINNEQDNEIINAQLRAKLMSILDSDSHDDRVHIAVHRSLIILSRYWPLNEHMIDPRYNRLVPQNIEEFEPIRDRWVADSEGYQYSIDEIYKIGGRSPFTRKQFHARDLAFMNARSGLKTYFKYSKQYPIELFTWRAARLPALAFFTSVCTTCYLFASKAGIALAFIALMGAESGLVVILFAAALFTSLVILATVLAGLVGLARDFSDRLFLKDAAEATIQLVDQIEAQATKPEYANPYWLYATECIEKKAESSKSVEPKQGSQLSQMFFASKDSTLSTTRSNEVDRSNCCGFF